MEASEMEWCFSRYASIVRRLRVYSNGHVRAFRGSRFICADVLTNVVLVASLAVWAARRCVNGLPLFSRCPLSFSLQNKGEKNQGKLQNVERKERPIIFSGPMVRAILENRKTQTRRIVAPMPGNQRAWLDHELIQKVPHGEIINGGWQMHHPQAGKHYMGVDVAYDSPLGWVRCPYGQPGDRLWVRETFSHILYSGPANGRGPGYLYRADMKCNLGDDWSNLVDPVAKAWKPSIHMPRKASRILLEVVSVRVERLQDITDADAFDEGVDMGAVGILNGMCKQAYQRLWETINGKGSWEANPWVWCIEFRRVDA